MQRTRRATVSGVRYLALALVACSVPRATLIADVERPAIALPLAPPVVLGPLDDAATAYNAPATAATTPLRDAVFDGLRALARERGDPRRDARLDLASDDLVDLVARGGAPTPAAIDFVLHGRGVIEPSVRVLLAHGATAEAVLAELREPLGDSLFFGNARVGIGGGGDRPLLVIVTHAALVTLAPTPRVLPAHGEATLDAVLDPRFHAPQLTLAHEDARGAVEHPLVWKADRYAFTATLACGAHTGTAWALIEARDDHEVVTRLALFPIACGQAPLDTYRVEAPARVPDDEVAHRLAAIVNRERAAAGLGNLRGDLRADAAAHREVLLMQRAHSVAHALGGTTTTDRLRAANLIPPSALEATLHAPDVAAAAEILMNERSYRDILVRPEATHLGVAIAFDEHHELYIALELVQVAPVIDTRRLATQILARINAARAADEQLATDKILDRLADRYTHLRALGWSDAAASEVLKGDPDLVFGPFVAMRRALSLMLDDDVAKVDLGARGPYNGLGISVAQSPRNGALAGRVWVMILYAKRR